MTEAYGGHSIEVGREVVCVAGGIFVFVIFSFVVRNVRVRAVRMMNRVQNGKQWGRGRGEKAPYPIVFFFVLGSAFAQLYRLVYEKTHQKYRQLLRLVEKEQEICSFLVFLAFAPLFMVTASVFAFITSIACINKSIERVRSSFISLTG